MQTQLSAADILASQQGDETPPVLKILYLGIVFGILSVILFFYIVVSGGILKGIIVILATIVLTPLMFLALVNFTTSGADASGAAALIIFAPVISAFTSVILTIIMAIYIFITPTSSTIV